MENIADKQAGKMTGSLHPSLQFLIFVLVFGGVWILGNILGGGVVIAIYGMKMIYAISAINTTYPNLITAMWILQFLSTTLPVFAAPVIFSRFIVKDTPEYVKPGFKFSWLLLVLVFAIMFLSSPLMELLTNINAKMVLPPFLKWMRDEQDQMDKLQAALLDMKTIGQMLFDLGFIGLLTAIAEEFMFRGAMQTIFEKWFKNKHVAIWVTAILFSAFHMEFFGFLPRMLLGAMFGYFVAYSGSIWPAVWGHFINNGTAVIVTYLYQHKLIATSPDDQHVFNWQGYVISPIIVIILFWAYYKIAEKYKQPALV
jgi:membrane protease YdiL (CAAX protease family)